MLFLFTDGDGDGLIVAGSYLLHQKYCFKNNFISAIHFVTAGIVNFNASPLFGGFISDSYFFLSSGDK